MGGGRHGCWHLGQLFYLDMMRFQYLLYIQAEILSEQYMNLDLRREIMARNKKFGKPWCKWALKSKTGEACLVDRVDREEKITRYKILGHTNI